jgi:hypothetical protein
MLTNAVTARLMARRGAEKRFFVMLQVLRKAKQPNGVRMDARGFLRPLASDDSVARRLKCDHRQPDRSITELHDSAMTMPHFYNKEHISPKFGLNYFPYD